MLAQTPALPILLVIAAVASLSACASSSSPASTAMPSASTALTVAEQSEIDAGLAAIAEAWGVTDPPDVETVRVVTREEAPSVIVDCLNAAGFPSELSPDGQSYATNYVADQRAALGLATYTCEAQYPTDPAQTGPLTTEQVVLSYEYLAQTLVACLADHGYPVDDVPTEETFVATYDTAPWNPYLELAEFPPESVQEACPMNTPADVLFAD